MRARPVNRKAYVRFFNKSANRRKSMNTIRVKRGGIKL